MSAIHWFEIAVDDIERARQFYGTLLNTEISVMDLTIEMGSKLGMLPDRGGIGGTLVENKQHHYEPSQQGTLIYLTVDGDLTDTLAKVEPAGGQVILPKTSLGDTTAGYVGWLIDTEGNRIGLWSQD